MAEPTKPCVSIVMPVFNAERFVTTAIRSVLAQSFSDFEFLVIDDGSEDHSLKICRHLAERRTRIITQKNHGVARARNTGIAEARGGIIALLDADDVWAPDKLVR